MFSPDFYHFLESVTPGFFSDEEKAGIPDVFIAGRDNVLLTRETESNLLRLLQAFYDPRSILRDCLRFPWFPHTLLKIAGNSNYLTDIVVRDPGPLYGFLTEGLLELPFNKTELRRTLITSLQNYSALEKQIAFLKGVKRREMLKIALRDLLGLADLPELLDEISSLAAVLTDTVFTLCHKHESLRICGKVIPAEYTLIALGKMGGGELNYSSDIDLMVFYKRNKKAGRKTEYYELLTSVIQLFSRVMSTPDENGFLYRVDFRLRPDGKSAPLCRTLTDTLRYYEARGEHWERQMLIKAGYISGSRNLYKDFISYITPFIYPASSFVSPLEQIRKIRGNILKANQNELNIKLSSGGIRDIEFGVQALQLLAGGKNPDIRTGNTLHALYKLRLHRLITEEEYTSLAAIYSHYRRIEHYLQLVNDQQTHTIPSEGEVPDKLAAYFGYENSAGLLKDINFFKSQVSKFYRSVTGQEEANQPEEGIDTIQFSDPAAAKKLYAYLKEGKSLIGERNFDTLSMQSFESVEPKILSLLRRAGDPDKLLSNMVKVLRQAAFPSVWYEQFRNDKFLEAFSALCMYDLRSMNSLPEDIYLQEKFLTGRVFEPDAIHHASNIKEVYFILSIRLLLGMITAGDFSQELSSAVKKKLIERLNELIPDETERSAICIITAGSISTGTMSFSSDADLIFIKADDFNPTEIQERYFALLHELKIASFPLEIDSRLRPEGRTSLLIFSISSYQEYLQKRARVWELQAMTKMSFLFGNQLIFEELSRITAGRLAALTPEIIRSEMLNMRKKLISESLALNNAVELKRGRGGYVDLEFIAQFLILSNSAYFAQILGVEFSRLISFFADNKIITHETGKTMQTNYSRLKAAEIFLQILEPAAKVRFRSESKTLPVLARFMGCDTPETLINMINKILSQNHLLLSRYLTESNE
ncbi:MAG: glutamate-ammonia-ligase adenylyltransferase [Ignavibacteriales bacterium]